MITIKKIYLFYFFIIISCSTFAQKSTRVAYLDLEYILENLPEYKVANEQFEHKVSQWRQELSQKQKLIDEQKQKLEAEKPLLSTPLIKDREEEIQIMELSLKELWDKRFAPDTGDYTQQMWQLVQPIENQIFNIAQEIAKLKKYDYIFTKDDVATIYADQKLDITKIVLRLLKRRENPEDRNKEISTLLREDFDLKDEAEKRRDEAKQKQIEDLTKRQSEREIKKQEIISEREKKLKERQQAREKAQMERQQAKEKALQARKEQQEKFKKSNNK